MVGKAGEFLIELVVKIRGQWFGRECHARAQYGPGFVYLHRYSPCIIKGGKLSLTPIAS